MTRMLTTPYRARARRYGHSGDRPRDRQCDPRVVVCRRRAMQSRPRRGAARST